MAQKGKRRARRLYFENILEIMNTALVETWRIKPF
jgi:hypothetical protein